MIVEYQNPYRGPFSYNESDEDMFFGRSWEVEELINLIRKNQLTILYGASGTGKTSLIHAKLMPQLKREYFHPIYIRINFANKDEDPLLFIQKRIVEELRIWDKHIPDFQPEQSLIYYAAQNVIFKGLIKPVLFFDQFEELFSLGPKTDPQKIHRFIYQLSELIELRLPDNLKTLDYINNVSSFKVVFSLRQDWIGFLDDFSQLIPSINDVRYRLKKFSPVQALEAIKSPSQNNITQEAAAAIIKKIGTPALWKEDTIDSDYLDKDLINLEVDPFVLSLYCYQLYDKCIQRGHFEITPEFVSKHQDTELIRNYFEEKIENYREIKYLIEEKLLNESGKRLIIPLNKFTSQNENVEQLTYKVANETGIVRIIGVGKESEIEIVHDRLAVEIFGSKNDRITKEATEKNREAEILKQSAQKAKKTTFAIGIASTVIIVLLTVFAVIITIKFKRNHNAQDLQEQLYSQTEDYQKAKDSIVALNSLMENIKLRLGTNIKVANNNEQPFELHDNSFVYLRSIDSLKNKNTSLAILINEKNEKIQNLENSQGTANSTIKELQAKLNSVRQNDTATSTASIPTFEKKYFSNFEILNNAINQDGSYILSDIKKKGFRFSFDLPSDMKTEQGVIDIRVYCQKDLQGNELKPIKKLKSLTKSIEYIIQAPSGIRPGKVTYTVKYYTDRSDPATAIDLKEGTLEIKRPPNEPNE